MSRASRLVLVNGKRLAQTFSVDVPSFAHHATTPIGDRTYARNDRGLGALSPPASATAVALPGRIHLLRLAPTAMLIAARPMANRDHEPGSGMATATV